MELIKWQKAEQIMKTLQSNGYEAYIVGGAVRNRVLGIPAYDIDLCTNALPHQVMSLFSNVIPTGIMFGTVMIIMSGISFEITTYRTESDYTDGRHPDHVTFVGTLREDLARRDFTINAMAIDVSGKITDPFDGKSDIDNKLIRAVGDAEKRFSEDGLRMIRGLRFMVQLDFQLHSETEKAMEMCKSLLNNVAIERIMNEFRKMMQSENAAKGWNKLHQLKILNEIPVFSNYIFEGKLTSSIITNCQVDFCSSKDVVIRWSVLLHYWQVRSDNIPMLLKRMTFSKREMKPIIFLMKLLESIPFYPDEKEEHIRLIIQYGYEQLTQYLNLRTIIFPDEQKENEQNRNQLDTLHQLLPIRSERQLNISGVQLMKYLKRAPGPWIQKMINKLTLAVALGHCKNEEQALLDYVQLESGETNEG